MQYRKKPVVIKAIKWDGSATSTIRIERFVGQELEMKPVPVGGALEDARLYIPTLEGVMEASIGDYIIKGIKGEFYPCKPDIFAATYEEVSEEEGSSKTYLTFGDAIRLLKNGEKLIRPGWNGKGMFLYYVPANSYPAQTDVAKKEFGENALVPYGAYFAFKSAQGTIEAGWKPSTMDMLAEDWEVIS